VGPKDGLDIVENKTISCPYWGSNADFSVVALSLFTD
jgi:hypothetical protein